MLLPQLSKTLNMKIAITGTFGAGKSSVRQILTHFGFTVVDCDQLAKSYYLNDSCIYDQLIELLQDYPNTINDGKIQLANLSILFFNHQDLKNKIETLIHQQLKKDLNTIFNKVETVFVEVPLLYELGWESMFDHVVVITCDTSIAVQRLEKYRNYNAQEYNKRMQYQMDANEKINRSDYVIYNNGDKDQLEMEVKIWLNKMNLID